MCAPGTHQRSRGNQGTHHGPIVAPRGDARPRAARPTQGSPPGSKTSTTAAACTPASAANPPSNTNYTKRPGQKPHKQTVNNLRTTPVGVEGGGPRRGGSTQRVGWVACVRLAGAGQSVLKAMGATVEDGHNVLLAGRFFGFVARENHHFRWSRLPRSCEYSIACLCVAP